ncbi:Chloroperoxidase [Lentinula detonsa]|uniref:Chloroperoxidase n=1 Tax=Lentinula detonsa TaxID=2804962 RepID=A0A9W8TWN1_9AGAR|nr:Chloroperoxidase [Lentinula detonsa]
MSIVPASISAPRFPLLHIEDDCFHSEASTACIASRAEDHSYIRPIFPNDSRAPCPGLNTLANHGYIPRSGRDIPFLTLIRALMEVYNISLPLALMLTAPAFLIYARFQLHWNSSASLKIAHRASLVHPDYPSEKPDTNMLHGFLSYARLSDERGCFTIHDLASFRVSRESNLPGSNKLDGIHEQVASGESSLTWLLFAKQISSSTSPEISLSYLEQWFGEERIPDGWTRPTETIGLINARKVAGQVQKEMKMVREAKGK